MPQPTAAQPHAGDEADLYRTHHTELLRVVRGAVNASDALVEDACQNAWIILLRRQPRRETVMGWLITVAIREAWRLSREERREAPLEELGGDAAWEELTVAPGGLDAQLEARRARAAVAGLPERQRRYVALSSRGSATARSAPYLERLVSPLAVDGGLTAATCRRWRWEAGDTPGSGVVAGGLRPGRGCCGAPQVAEPGAGVTPGGVRRKGA